MKKEKTNLKITHVKGSGPGGQHRNKRQTGILIEDLETGVTVRVTERRSQSQNLTEAFERLEEKIEKLNYRPAPRRATKPKRAAKEKRIEKKKRHAQKKSFRQNKNHW